MSRRVGTLSLLLLALGCGDRDDKWSESVELSGSSVGLSGSVALVDAKLDRVVLLNSERSNDLSHQVLKVGKDVASVVTSPDLSRLFVLSKGVQPRKNRDDELPSITVIDGAEGLGITNYYELSDPKLELSIDPLEKWLVAFSGDSTVTNPNEFVFFDLDDDDGRGHPVTIRSSGGVPEEVLFTEPLTVPEGPARRFAIVRTDLDIALIDLADLDAPEITVGTSKTAADVPSRPVQIAVDPGLDAGDDEPTLYGRIALRLEGQSDVMLLELGETAEEGKDFAVKPNLVDVGGVPSAIEFVRTDFGLRLAALVPSRSQARLVDPQTTVVETVDLPRGYSEIRRVSEDVPEQGELALLYSADTPGFAFWSLGSASGTPFRSVEQGDTELRIRAVRDVPGDDYGHLKVLESSSQGRFLILDLSKRTTFPMLTKSGITTVTVAPDGQRAWAFGGSLTEFSMIDLSDFHPTSLAVSLPVSEVHDIERADGSRAALAMHGIDGRGQNSTLGVTLLEAEEPDSAETTFFGHIMLEGL